MPQFTIESESPSNEYLERVSFIVRVIFFCEFLLCPFKNIIFSKDTTTGLPSYFDSLV